LILFLVLGDWSLLALILVLYKRLSCRFFVIGMELILVLVDRSFYGVEQEVILLIDFNGIGSWLLLALSTVLLVRKYRSVLLLYCEGGDCLKTRTFSFERLEVC